jgi:hypothetical protein
MKIIRLAIFLVTLTVWKISTIPTSIQMVYFTNLAIFSFTANLDILKASGINYHLLLEDFESYKVSNSYGISAILSLLAVAATCLYVLTKSNAVAISLHLAVFIFWIQPFKLYQNERKAIQKTFYSSIIIEKVTFGQILFSDILTTYSKIIATSLIETWRLIFPADKQEHLEIQQQQFDFIIPFLVMIPFIIRLRQCLHETTQENTIKSRINYFNAIKYFTALPLIIANKFYDGEWSSDEIYYFYFWFIISAVNSLYSLYWDIVMDWNLMGKLSISEISPDDQVILRKTLHFTAKCYYFAVLFNSVARFSWILKLFASSKVLDMGLVFLEICRRWIWVFLRLEREWSERGFTYIQTKVVEE